MAAAPRKASPRKAPAKKAAPKKTAPARSLVDELQAEVGPLPDGAPELVSFVRLNRRQRANLIRAFKAIEPKMDDYQKIVGSLGAGAEPTDEQTVVMLDFMADIEDLIVSGAFDAETAREWALTADDRGLLAVFSHMASGLGEASSSST